MVSFARARALGFGVSTLALVAAAMPALAQTTPAPAAEEGDTIVVTGFRASLESAAKTKKNSDQIVESITAEDIGKLPDNSIAESISRLPGLTSQRLDGRSNSISIRGFAPDFSTTLLNGREQVSINDNRGVEYDQYPSEVIGRVDVYKTPNAQLIGQGLSGTVDLRTIKPLAYGKQAITVGARAEYNDNGKLNAGSKSWGYRVNALYVGQFADDTVGVMLGIAHINQPNQVKKFNAWGYPNATPSAVVIGGSKSYVQSTDTQRTGVVGTLEFKPTDSFSTSFDVFYSKFKDNQILRGIELPLYWSAATLQPGFTTTNGLVTAGQFNGVKGVVRNDANVREADTWSLGWNGQYKANGWILTGDAAYSKVDRSELVLETYSGTGRNAVGATDNIRFTEGYAGAVFTPSLNYGDYNLIQLTSPQGWGGNITPATGPGIVNGQDGYYNNRLVKDELKQFRASVERELDSSFLKSVEAGAAYTDRSKSLTPNEFFLGLKANTNGTTSVPIPTDLRLGTTNLAFLGLGPMVSYDPVRLLNSGIYNQIRNPNSDVAVKGWSVSEKVFAAYLMAKISADVGSAKLTGNIGLQYQNTDQSSVGTATSGAPIVLAAPISGSAKFGNWLPSLNLSLRTPTDWVVRLGLARQLARPRMTDMRVSSNYSFSVAQAQAGVSPFSREGGNINLRPWVADALDISVEKYFGGGGYVALAGYYKNLKSYIYNAVIPYDFTGFPVPINPATNQPYVLTAAQRIGPATVPQNGTGGSLYGAEFSFQLPFKTLSESLDGFGLTGSASYTKSEILSNGPGSNADDLPGYSKWVASVTGYFEKNGFSARTSLRYRSSFLGELSGFGGDLTRRRANGETIVDAQIGYEFQEGSSLKGLSLLVQGTNLTDAPFRTFNPGQENQVIDYQTFGRRFLFGVSYKM
ncbi:TonB-dependent receptor [Sphingomonas sp. SUN039]|uniref:TonB-dependent receptor n=1 Tax=Sphingomonas sp. SUN039 TaxID=2937787 RepID=UPI0021647CD6|nr:TonB-dependent receptor [Sphingomonas sp. SUN039]UVO55059.1 TonB-dependent receptor [Sphingomonas sp. SUN039]